MILFGVAEKFFPLARGIWPPHYFSDSPKLKEDEDVIKEEPMVFRPQPHYSSAREVSPETSLKAEATPRHLPPTSSGKRKECDIEPNTVIGLPNFSSKRVEKTPVPSNGPFRSILSVPFGKWNDIESAIMMMEPDWTPKQRGSLIESLIQFLELKVTTEGFIPAHLVAPTRLVEKAWRALIMDTRLYKKVVTIIQSFHNKTKKPIHYSVLEYSEEHTSNYYAKVRRTQSLMKSYYGSEMPESLDDADTVCSEGDTSTLTDAMARFDLKTTFSGFAGFGKFDPDIIQKKIKDGFDSIEKVVNATSATNKEPVVKRQRVSSPPQSTATSTNGTSAIFQGSSCMNILEETCTLQDDVESFQIEEHSIMGGEHGIEVLREPPAIKRYL